MAKSNYEFRKLNSKPMPAKIVDSTAVRVLAKAAKKLGLGWKKFIEFTSTVVKNTNAAIKDAKVEAVNNNINRMTAKIEDNNNLINSIRNDANANAADFTVMSQAQAENEKLTGKIGDLTYKNVEPKITSSNDLNSIIDKALNASGNEVVPTTVAELDKAFDAAGIKNIVANEVAPKVEEKPIVEKHVEAPKPIEVAKTVEAKKDVIGEDQVVNEVINAIKATNDLKTKNNELQDSNNKLVIDNNTKDARITDLETQLKTVSDERDGLKIENQTLRNTNSNQVTTIAGLNKERDALSATIKDQKALEDKIRSFEETIKQHDRERDEMLNEFEKLRFSASENQKTLEIMRKDYATLTDERNRYKNYIISIQTSLNAANVIQPSNVEESKTR